MSNKSGRKRQRRVLDLEQVKRRVIVAMFSEDEFMECFVLKGGNALDIVHRVSARASLDVDLSMGSAFSPGSLEGVRVRLQAALRATFHADGLVVFDLNMKESLPDVSPQIADFWGGYRIEFKLISQEDFRAIGEGDIEGLRSRALNVGENRTFTVDVSKYEYVEGKQAEDLEGFRIYVYTPEMIVAEKLRAICQQMPEYGSVVLRSRPGAPRARDYIDIHTLVAQRRLDMLADGNLELCRNVFRAKRVPLGLLRHLPEQREFHRTDWPSVVSTVKPGFPLQPFEYYADFVEALSNDVASRLADADQKPAGT